jgi:hypothetical protein
MLRPPHAEGRLSAIRVEVRGVTRGAAETLVFGAIDRAAVAAGAVAAVAVLATARPGAPTGVVTLADLRLETNWMLAELARRGLRASRFTGTPTSTW